LTSHQLIYQLRISGIVRSVFAGAILGIGKLSFRPKRASVRYTFWPGAGVQSFWYLCCSLAPGAPHAPAAGRTATCHQRRHQPVVSGHQEVIKCRQVSSSGHQVVIQGPSRGQSSAMLLLMTKAIERCHPEAVAKPH